MKKVALYLRVSRDGQTTQNQRLELYKAAAVRDWEVVEVHEDNGISGSKGRRDRPALDKVMKRAVQGKIDGVMAWSVDRLGRSLGDLVNIMGDLNAAGVGLYLHQQALDTSTPSGRAMFQMCGVFAEFEKAILVERTKAGLARARANGTQLGRHCVFQDYAEKVMVLRAEGKGMLKIAKILGIGSGTVQKVIRESKNIV